MKALIANDAECGFGLLADLTPGFHEANGPHSNGPVYR
jgi:hypothetical protein